MNLRKIAASPPRALVIVAKMKSDEPPLGRKKLPPSEFHQRLYNASGHVAAGSLPLDDTTAPIVAKALEARYRQFRRQAR